MAKTKINPIPNASNKVTGDLQIFDRNGKLIKEVNGEVYLCRCGGSKNKPFCDGTHGKIGFRD